MYGNVVPMHYLKGLDVSLDLSEIEMCGPWKYIERMKTERQQICTFISVRVFIKKAKWANRKIFKAFVLNLPCKPVEHLQKTVSKLQYAIVFNLSVVSVTVDGTFHLKPVQGGISFKTKLRVFELESSTTNLYCYLHRRNSLMVPMPWRSWFFFGTLRPWAFIVFLKIYLGMFCPQLFMFHK